LILGFSSALSVTGLFTLKHLNNNSTLHFTQAQTHTHFTTHAQYTNETAIYQ